MTGIILAGGNSSRISTDKAFLELRDRPIIADTLDTLARIFQQIVIVTNRPEKYDFPGTKRITDIIPRKGPLGGLYTGLAVSKTEYNFVVACDMPLLNSDLILYMLERREGYDVVVPHVEAGLEPLHAVYSKACLEPIQVNLAKGDLRLQSFFSQVRTKYIQQLEIRQFEPELRAFFNVNDHEDFKKLKTIVTREDA